MLPIKKFHIFALKVQGEGRGLPSLDCFLFSSYVIRLKPHLERSSAFIVIYLSVFASIYLVVVLLSIGFFFFLWKPTEICDHIAVSRESINEIYLQPSSGKHFEVLCLSRKA